MMTVLIIYGLMAIGIVTLINGETMQEKLYDFTRRDRVRNIFIYLARFFENLGPSISAVSVVGIFIPVEKVTILTLVSVFFLGIIITIAASCIEKLLTK